MRIVEINTVNRGSTGSIMLGLADYLIEHGHVTLVCYPMSRDNIKNRRKGDYLVGNRFVRNIGRFISQHFMAEYCIHIFSTLCLILRLQIFKPDIVHLHNIHDSFLNFPLFFRYMKKKGIPIVWTMHDCWLYTGHCTHYITNGCVKWRFICKECEHYRDYPYSSYDDSTYKYLLKKKLLSFYPKLTLVPVSSWLSDEVSKSFLREVDRIVIPNGVDINVFAPLFDKNVKDKYGIPSGHIIMAVATDWDKNKGFDDYCRLSQKLENDEYIVLVGVHRERIVNLPPKIIGIERTDSKTDLAKLYTISDVVLSLSYAETFGLTIVEANACGVPVVVYDNTSQPELVTAENGFVVKTGDIDEVYDAVKKIFKVGREQWQVACRRFASEKYSDVESYNHYVNVFEKVIIDKRKVK